MSSAEEKWAAANHALRTVKDKLLKAQLDVVKLAAERDTLQAQLTEKDKEIAELRASLNRLGHMEEPKEFNHDQTYGFLFACEKVIERARQALQNTKKEG